VSGEARRFYRAAAAEPVDGGAHVLLDGRPLRTPGRAPLLAPTEALAAAIAAEWDAQIEIVRPETMPLTRLVNVAIDRTPMVRAEMIAMIAHYAETELIAHRAEAPASLVALQAARWDPLIGWAEAALGARLSVQVGIVAADGTEPARDAFAAHAARADDFALTGLAHGAGMFGSAVIAFALAAGRLDAQSAHEAAHLDELYQLERWGEDAEARARLDRLAAEAEALGVFFASLR
jgi:chaperone required for assembly of F1-ATPase